MSERANDEREAPDARSGMKDVLERALEPHVRLSARSGMRPSSGATDRARSG